MSDHNNCPSYHDDDDDDDDDDEQLALQDLDILLQETICPKNFRDGLARGVGHIVAGAIGAVGMVVLSPYYSYQHQKTCNHKQILEKDSTHKHNYNNHNNDDEDQVIVCRKRSLRRRPPPRNSLDNGVLVNNVKGGLSVGAISSGVHVAAESLVVGMNLIVKGLVNTPSAMIQPRRGRWWSTYEGKWMETHLKSEQEWIQTQPECDDDILGEQALPVDALVFDDDDDDDNYTESFQPITRAEQFHVVETDLYDQLGVDPDASDDEIQHRYSLLARMLSPTRAGGGDTPAANERRRQIGIAYMILTTFRETYDREGMQGIYAQDDDNDDQSGKHSLQHVNPIHLYSLLFGSDKFDAYFGRLVTATEALLTPENTTKITLADARLLQKRRVTRLALQLAQRLQVHVQGDEETACQAWEEGAKDLCDSHYGVELVQLIGSVYTLTAAQFLGSFDSGIGIPSIRQWARNQTLTLKESYKSTIDRVNNLAMTGNSRIRKTDLKDVVLRDAHQLLDSKDDRLLLPDEVSDLGNRVLEALWSRTVVDVTTTIHEAAQMVLFDQDRNDDTRRRRGLALQILGTIFQKCNHIQSDELQASQAEYQRIAFHTVLQTILGLEIATRNASGAELVGNKDQPGDNSDGSSDDEPCAGEPCSEVLLPAGSTIL